MTDKEKQEYLDNDGKLFYIFDITNLKNGCIKLHTNLEYISIFLDKDKMYTSYPLNEDDLITDPLYITYIKEKISEYMADCTRKLTEAYNAYQTIIKL